jgi:hypothetical protein
LIPVGLRLYCEVGECRLLMEISHYCYDVIMEEMWAFPFEK